MSIAPDPVALVVAEVAAAVLAHPGVARLDGGPFGTVATYLPGGRIVGVRLGGDDEAVEVAVVAWLGTPLPRLAGELGAAVRQLLGPVAVEVLFSDVVPPAGPAPGPPDRADHAVGRLA